MIIQNMFEEDINRPINGVIKVDQDELGVIEQEVKEYVITKELKKHFISFFNYYSDSFDKPTSDMGVWISGFFGSGKSHFLKMLSYILENRSIGGVKTVEFFRKKFESDPATFMMIDKATRGKTETILFNIDIEGFSNKDKTAVLRVFAKMFYNHLGLYGEDLKVAKLEQFIAKQGKTDEFRRVFEEKNGSPWVESRDAYAFFEDDVVDTLTAVLGMSETAARNWFNGTETAEISIAQLVSEIKDYVDSKPDNFLSCTAYPYLTIAFCTEFLSH
jgi:energy-coupling factor transporter ATP-binding protein EcfA2